MRKFTLNITAHGPIIARDGRPFGAGQGQRMRGLPWPLPSAVAGSFRTALVKEDPKLDFADPMPQRLLSIAVAGVFPAVEGELNLPAPADCVWDHDAKVIHKAWPHKVNQGGCDLPAPGLLPVLFSDDPSLADFKPEPPPAWWPVSRLADWLLGKDVSFDETFLGGAVQETRDHTCLDADRGAAAKKLLFSTAGLNVTHLPRHGVDGSRPFSGRYAAVTLSARVRIPDSETGFEHAGRFRAWHPLGGERRLVHWQAADGDRMWACPPELEAGLRAAERIRMVLVTPAIFEHGWRPNWLKKVAVADEPSEDGPTSSQATGPGTSEPKLVGKPFDGGPTLRLVGVVAGRWKAVSGWSLAKPVGPKAIRRMVPAGSVYFFEKVEGDCGRLADEGWLAPVSDSERDRNDGFGLAAWGTW